MTFLKLPKLIVLLSGLALALTQVNAAAIEPQVDAKMQAYEQEIQLLRARAAASFPDGIQPQPRAPANADVSPTTTASPSTSTFNCTTTFWQFPTPEHQGPKYFTVWTSTFTEGIYFDCHGCTGVISNFPQPSSTHYHRTTTISSILTYITQACYDPPLAPWLSTQTTTATRTNAPSIPTPV